jgi:hypothetical protein
VLVRVFATSLLFLGPGCFGHCGPTLDRLEFTATFPGELTNANRTTARDSLLAMGFELTEFDGPGGFYMEQGDTRVFVGNRSADARPITTWVFDQDLPNREFDSGDEARAAGRSQAPAHWARFNATLTDFETRTGWSASRPSDVEVLVYVC